MNRGICLFLEDLNAWDASKLSYEFGEKNRKLPFKEKEVAKVAFQQKFISTPWDSHDIKIIANSSKNWGTVQESAVKYGVLIHELLSKIHLKDEVDKVLHSYVMSGEVSVQEQPIIKTILEKIVSHQLLQHYFSTDYKIYTEREIVDEYKRVLIPDRLMFRGNKVVIMDYKTGARSISHKEQLESYSAILTKMGFAVEKRILIYVENTLIIEEV